MKRLIIEVVDVSGKCVAGLKIGNIWEISENICVMGENICYFALSSLMPTLLAIQLGSDLKSIGLSNEPGVAYMQCSDIGDPLTPGGRVTFKIREKFPSSRGVSAKLEGSAAFPQEVKAEVRYVPRSPACQACGACSMQQEQVSTVDEEKLKELIINISRKMLKEQGR